MKKHLVIDSSVFLSNLFQDETNHAATKQFFQKIIIDRYTMLIPLIVLFEVLQAYFRRSNDLKKTDQIYKEMIECNMTKTLRIINIEASFLTYFTAFHHLFHLKTADCIVALTAHRFKYPLITLDKKLLAASKQHIDVYTPPQFLDK